MMVSWWPSRGPGVELCAAAKVAARKRPTVDSHSELERDRFKANEKTHELGAGLDAVLASRSDETNKPILASCSSRMPALGEKIQPTQKSPSSDRVTVLVRAH